jgi:selenide,water dikinase
MRRLNAAAASAMQAVGAHACTDITGYGLLGHLFEMVKPVPLLAEIDPERVPSLPFALEHARAGDKPGGLHANRAYVAGALAGEEGHEPERIDLLCDPQTSGGLLIAVAEEKAEALVRELAARGVDPAAEIGRLLPDPSNEGRIRLTSARAARP